MLSPFPGMDPYLEDKRWWSVFHTAFIVGLMERLNRSLPDQYVASSEQRLYIEEHRRAIRPDVSIIAVPRSDIRSGGLAVADAVDAETDMGTDEMWEVEYLLPHVIERFIEIIVAGDESRVIAVIELISPANKSAHSSGREEYLAKQDEVLSSDTHLVEIDLLREGLSTVAAFPGELLRHGHCDHLVCLTPGRSSDRRIQTVWPIQLRKKLPRVRIPLGPGESPVPLDLQAVFDEVYEKAAFAKRIDYQVAPAVPLTRVDADWLEEVLLTKGLRTKTSHHETPPSADG